MRENTDEFGLLVSHISRILESKLLPPTSGSLIFRSLNERLFSNNSAKLILICGPAGFGKTSLMVQYESSLRRQQVACGWLTLDSADNDVNRLLIHLDAALNRIEDDFNDRSGTASIHVEPTSDGALDAVFRLSTYKQPFVLFIDEFEAIKSSIVLDFIQLLISHLPSSGRIVIGSRNHPNLGLGRLRIRGQLLVLGVEDLRFSIEETRELIRSKKNLSLTNDDAIKLHKCTEGWVAALQLASLSLAQHKNFKTFISAFSKESQDIAECLSEDVFLHQSPEVKRFLLGTCILKELSAPLCDAVMGRTDSATMLDQLERSGLFLTHTGERFRTYRYHAMFASFLRNQLYEGNLSAIPLMHLQAAEWFAAENRPVPAIEHAIEANNYSLVMSLLAEHAERLLKEGRFELLGRWFARIPDEVLQPQVDVLMIFALSVPRKDRSFKLKKLLDGVLSSDEYSQRWINTYKMHSLTMEDRLMECLQSCAEERTGPSSEIAIHKNVSILFRANTLVAANQFSKAFQYIDECKHVFSKDSSGISIALSEEIHAIMELGLGQLNDATHRLRRTYDRMAPSNFGGLGATIGAALAIMLYERGEDSAAEQLLSKHLTLAKEWGLPDMLIAGTVMLARIVGARGHQDEALEMLAGMEALGYELGLRRVLASTWLERARMAILAGAYPLGKSYLDNANDVELWKSLNGFSPYANDVNCIAIGQLRLMLHTGRSESAIPILKKQMNEAKLSRRRFRGLKLKIFFAYALYATGDRRNAMRNLREALQFAHAEGFVSVFREEGARIAEMIREFRDTGLASEPTGEVSSDFLNLLLTSAGSEPSPIKPAGMIADLQDQREWREDLTRKELKVLLLLSKGLSNQQLANQLFVSESTVKTHLARINTKLGVGNRLQAVAIARELRLIP